MPDKNTTMLQEVSFMCKFSACVRSVVCSFKNYQERLQILQGCRLLKIQKSSDHAIVSRAHCSLQAVINAGKR